MSPIKNKPDLISEYYLRTLSADELKTLQDLLAEDVGAREEFVRVGRDEWLLHHMHHAEGQRIIHLLSRRSRRRSIQVIAAAAALFATLGMLIFSQSATISEMIASSRPSAPVIANVTDYFAVEGEAISVVNNGHVRKLNSTSAIRSGDRVIIPPGCQLSFQYLEEQTDIRLGGNSLVHVKDVEGAKRIRLDHGYLSAEVARQPEGRPMRVVTRDAEVVVLGTSFEVVAEERTRLSVIRGKVQFTSLDRSESRIVSAGYFSDTSEKLEPALPFMKLRIKPELVQTLNFSRKKFMVVDPERNAEGFMVFDIGAVKGRILEARLRLRVTAWQKEYGGRGDLRLYRVDPDQQGEGRRISIAHFSGGAGKGKDLELDLDVSLLSAGRNAFVLTMDKGGNDFWFSADESEQAPVLELKIADQR
ncbi:FecR family protein [Pontiella agarivorans]|uniref:FecR family protein n=1 Tax=Pontiella agarivorans TaxID=3038953 RepID=A0ABU5N0B0_9BACT|nr:FecR family protein [Pontiella agarivorans]MDZ8119867.1 FecR family protein [Pontiella agarivorans]